MIHYIPPPEGVKDDQRWANLTRDCQGGSMLARVAYAALCDGARNWPDAHVRAALGLYGYTLADRA